VARSRHKNGVERSRGADPYRILIQPGPLDEKICAALRGESAGLEGVRRRRSGVEGVVPGAEAKPLGGFPRRGHTGGRGPGVRGSMATLRPARGSTPATLALMGAPAGAGGAGRSGPAGLGRRTDRFAPRGGVDSRRQSEGYPMWGRVGARRGHGPPARAGAGVGGTDGTDSTTRSPGPCGSLGATRATGNGG
jgi:hypothetical protein